MLNLQSLIFTGVVGPHCFPLPEIPSYCCAVMAPLFKGEGAPGLRFQSGLFAGREAVHGVLAHPHFNSF